MHGIEPKRDGQTSEDHLYGREIQPRPFPDNWRDKDDHTGSPVRRTGNKPILMHIADLSNRLMNWFTSLFKRSR